MSLFRLSIISAFSLFALVFGASTVFSESISPELRIPEFNEEVSKALTRGETWPCSPINQASRWFGLVLGGPAASNQFSCSKTAGDSVAIVSTRVTHDDLKGANHWAELRFERSPKQVWRLTSVDTLPLAADLATPLLRGIEAVGQVGTNEPDEFQGMFKNYSAEVGGIRMVLEKQAFSSIGCGPKENGLPVGHLESNKPSPHSVQQTGFCVLEKAEISITVETTKTRESRKFAFGFVEPSLYMVELDRDKLGPGGHVLQVWCNGLPTPIKFVGVN